MRRGRPCARAGRQLISITMKKQPTVPPAAAPRPRGRPRSFDREAALDAAMEVFREKGYEAASVSDLTEAMGINPPSLYAAFGDKEGLFLEAVKRYRAQMMEECPYAVETSAREALRQLLTDLVQYFTEPGHARGCLMLMASTTAATTSPRLQELLAEERAAGKARLRARLEAAVRNGELPADTDVGALANFYAAVIAGMSLQARDGASRKSLVATVEAAMRAWPGKAAAKRKRAGVAA